MAPDIDTSALAQNWVHSHEEDGGGAMVFRPQNFPFPPSRGRKTFDLRSGGAAVFQGIGPEDRPSTGAGNWALEGNKLLLDDPTHPGSKREYEIESVSNDKLVIKK